MLVSITPLFGPHPKVQEISFSFCEEIALPTAWKKSFLPTTPLCGRVEVMRLEADVLVFLKEATFSAKVRCGKCLQKEEITIDIREAEQIFYSEKKDLWGEEDFSINWKKNEIDLAPFFLQEIGVRIPEIFQHEENRCDPVMLQRIQELSGGEEQTPLQGLQELWPQAHSEFPKKTPKRKKPIS